MRCFQIFKDRNGNIPLHIASYRGDNDLVDILMKEEDLSVTNNDGLCAFHLAMSKRQTE